MAPAADVNATRFALLGKLKNTGIPVETGTGGQTKWNRSQLRIPKTHALDAACVGEVTSLQGWDPPTLEIKAYGKGSHKRTRLTANGFPRGYLAPAKSHFGFRTGDLVKAQVPSGKKSGTHTGRVAVRASGSFNIQSSLGTIQGISHKHCRKLQSADGYSYQQSMRGFPSALKGRVSATSI